jgi:hypothetical protein
MVQWYIPVYTVPMLFIEEVCLKLSARGVRYALAGGYAVALHGAVRGTVDIDIVVDWNRANLKNAIGALEELGLVSRLPVGAGEVFDFRDEYVANRSLIAWNFHHAEDATKQVDVIITYDLTGRSRERIRTASGTVYVLTRKDLIAMKEASGREQDLADVDALRRLE